MNNDVSRILVAEDEEHISKLIAFKLRKEGHEVSVAFNGEEALRVLEAGVSGAAWDLIILDVMMPICDGWQVLKKIRQSTDAALKDLPILMLTAKNSETDMAKSAELGATQFLKKPFDPSDLARVVQKLLSEKQAGK